MRNSVCLLRKQTVAQLTVLAAFYFISLPHIASSSKFSHLQRRSVFTNFMKNLKDSFGAIQRYTWHDEKNIAFTALRVYSYVLSIIKAEFHALPLPR